MPTTLEQSSSRVLYGNGGPDKWDFIHQGVLDRRHNGTPHTFTIGGKKTDMRIVAARQIPSWQCPPHPDINPEQRSYLWSEAWEFSGVGDLGRILGIYSTTSRRGVYHVWPIRLVDPKSCKDSRMDIFRFFTDVTNSEALMALTRAMEHMVRGSALGGYHVDCEECWDVFKQLRQQD